MSSRTQIRPGPMVYLAGPIAATPETAMFWREKAAERLTCEGDVVAFNPSRAFQVPDDKVLDSRYIKPLQVVNDVAIVYSSCVLVHVAKDILSGGTEHEMRLCAELKKPVVLWVPWMSANEAYSTGDGHCQYIDAVYADYGTELRLVFTARYLKTACAEAAKHAMIIGLADSC